MKTAFLFGLTTATFVFGSSLNCHTLSAVSKDSKTIIIVQKPTTPPEAPRMPAYNPFFAELMDGYVILGSSTVYGTVSVSLTSTAGDNYSTSFDTSDGAILLPISGDAGLYTLRITTSGGLQFVGEFTI